MISIDTSQQFLHLSKAPIVEAIIEIRTNTEKPWEESTITNILKERLPKYPALKPQREFKHEFKVSPGQKAEQNLTDLGFKGLRLQSEDNVHIAQFNRDSFIFSHLYPYDNWNQFKSEAMQLWSLHKELACPVIINRLGVRFINKITLPAEELNFKDYLQEFPQSPGKLDLPCAGFFHQDTLVVPDYPYKINIILTIQKSPEHKGVNLILDIDVFNDNPFKGQDDFMLKNLEEMRWLKNSMFFNCITDKTLEMLK